MEDYKGRLSFFCADRTLNEGFSWARDTALSYVFEGDPAGDWYEAALPGRQAFCMRDVSHQTTGAQALGLSRHNKNMLRKFAQSVAESRDFCGFWEIDREYRPAPVDYTNDGDFWYNLPANFDVLDACRRMYDWTGDDEYVLGVDFNHFYALTTEDYIRRWDRDGDDVPERTQPGSRRGIPSYDEGIGLREARLMPDLIAIEARAFDSHAVLCACRGDRGGAKQSRTRAAALRELLRTRWWDPGTRSFYGAQLSDGRMVHHEAGDGFSGMLLYYGGVADPVQRASALDRLDRTDPASLNVETLSYFPTLFYENGRTQSGCRLLSRLLDPSLARREYPEVSFAAIGCIVESVMGIRPDAHGGRIETRPRLLPAQGPAELKNCPVFGGAVDLRYADGKAELANRTGREIVWNGTPVPAGGTARQPIPA